MPIRRRLFAFGLLAVLPALASAQTPKLVNCRTLEAAGNFVGPDEVIVDDMVCQKAKPGANATAKPQAQKPIAGMVISEAPAESIVDAAKAAEKRVAIRREQEAAKNAIVAPADGVAPADAYAAPVEAPITPGAAAQVAVAPAPSTKVVEPVTAPAPAATSAPEPAPIASAPEVQPVSQPLVSSPPEPALQTAAPTTAVDRRTEGVAPAEAVTQSVPSTMKADTTLPMESAAAPAVAAKTEAPAPEETVISSAPTSAPADANPTVAPSPAPPALEPAGASSEPVAARAPAPAAESAPVDPARPATTSGFYDANAPKPISNVAPQANTGFASADQVNAGLTPGATAIPAAAQPDPEVQHTTIAAARIDFDPDRDRSVKLGDFAKPREAAPEETNEHRTSVDPSDADGFQDRQRAECTKNITLAGLSGEKLVLGVPAWAARWIEKNEKRVPQICFSETPMKSARNYLIVFSTPAGRVSKEAAAAAVNPANGSPAGVGTFTTLYGSTWHYSFDRNVGTTILTQDDADEPHGAPGQVLYATAYTEEGVPVAQRWPGQLKKELKPNEKSHKKLKGEAEALEHVSSDLLSQMVDDIEKL